MPRCGSGRLSDGKDVGVFRKHGSPVVRAAFAGNGRQTVSGDRDGTVLIWNIDRFLPKPSSRSMPGGNGWRPGYAVGCRKAAT